MRRLLVTLTLLFALLPAAGALASGSAVIRDCTDAGRLEGHYSQHDLHQALSSIPTDVDEYTNCRDVIRRAALAGGGGGGKGGAPGGGSGGTDAGSSGEVGGFAPPAHGAHPRAGARPDDPHNGHRAVVHRGTPN